MPSLQDLIASLTGNAPANPNVTPGTGLPTFPQAAARGTGRALLGGWNSLMTAPPINQPPPPQVDPSAIGDTSASRGPGTPPDTSVTGEGDSEGWRNPDRQLPTPEVPGPISTGITPYDEQLPKPDYPSTPGANLAFQNPAVPYPNVTGQTGRPDLVPNSNVDSWMTSMGLRGTPGNGVDPALGRMMIEQPETVAAHLAASGVAPPADVPEGTTPDDAHASLGKALTPSQQGAAEAVPLPRSRPTPSPESVDSTGAAVPAPDTSKQPGRTGVNAKAEVGKASPMDDLAKALAGLKPIPPPEGVRVSTPAAPRATSQISRSTLPSVFLQQLGKITQGEGGRLRLGQALAGIRQV